MIDAAVHYSVIAEILSILSSRRSPEEKNQAISQICQPIASALEEKQRDYPHPN